MINNKLRAEAKNEFEKVFFKLMNKAAFGETMSNVKKHIDITFATTERRRNYLVSEPNYHTTKLFTKNVLAIEMEKTQIIINKPVYLELSVTGINLCHMDTDSFIFQKKKASTKIL